MEYPLPPVMVSCGSMEKPNVMTAAWTGIVSSDPAMTYVSIRPSRYSHELIKESGEFVINLTTLPLVTAADFCGVKSGRDTDKFKEMNLTPGACSQVSCPQIMESPVSIECKVVSVTNYGSHDMFLAEIVAVNVDDKYLDQDGKLWLEKAGLIAYSHNYYYTLGRNVGFFGFSVCRSALKAREKMKNVVVEVKEPKIAKTEKDSKFTRKNGPRNRKTPADGKESSTAERSSSAPAECVSTTMKTRPEPRANRAENSVLTKTPPRAKNSTTDSKTAVRNGKREPADTKAASTAGRVIR